MAAMKKVSKGVTRPLSHGWRQDYSGERNCDFACDAELWVPSAMGNLHSQKELATAGLGGKCKCSTPASSIPQDAQSL